MMSKVALFVVLAVAFMPQCHSRNARNENVVNSDPTAKSTSEKSQCDFSRFNPMAARANYSSRLVSMPTPVYPEDARGKQIGGRVSVLLLVNVQSGLVEDACVREGDRALAASARDAALKVKFAPYSSYIQKKYSYALEVVSYRFEPQ